MGVEMSAGYVWSASTDGTLFKINQEEMTIADSYKIGVPEMIGVAIDYEGYVWTVSREDNTCYKFDPIAETFQTVKIGEAPYTYSDMTGVQLRNAVIIK